jgi:formyltetrahydrofolate-dependent phosphoribosylglycinamide formyltransferase
LAVKNLVINNARTATPPLGLAVLVSGSGTTLQNLIDRIAGDSLRARIDLVISSRPDVLAVGRAREAGIPIVVINPRDYSSAGEFSRAVFAAVERQPIDLVCLAGWLSLLELPRKWVGKVMNIHPALLPKFGGRGMFGRHIHEAVLAAGARESGCTVHYVNDQYDEGPIILQKRCEVLPTDTPNTLAARVFELEKEAYPAAIEQFARRS